MATRDRRTKEETEALRAELVRLALAYSPCTVRQVFYAAVSAGLIPKTEQAYRGIVSRYLGTARENGELPWDVIADQTRSVYQRASWDSLRDVVTAVRHQYRRNLWSSQDVRVEVWTESRTLMGALKPVIDEWGVPLYPCGGYPSKTFLHDAAEDIELSGKHTLLLYLGDWDPSGRDIERHVLETIERYAPDADVELERLAVTPEQVEHMGLPVRPPKSGDPRARGFVGGCIEVEALAPDVLRRMVGDAIEANVDAHEIEVLRVAEESERSALRAFSAGMWSEGAELAEAAEEATADL